MQIEHATKVFPLDADLEANIQKMNSEGWMVLPGMMPVAIYHVVRTQNVPVDDHKFHEAKPIAKLTIDETKIKILRNGELIDG